MTPSARPIPRRDLLGYGLGLVGVAMFAGTLPATRIAVTVFDPWVVTVGRAAIAAVLAALLLLVMRRRFPPRRCWPMLLLAAVTTVIGFPILSATAMLTVPASHGGVVLGFLPLATSVAAMVINGERPSLRFWAFSLAGAAVLAIFTLRDADTNVAAGDLLLVASVVSASIGYNAYARIAGDVPGWESISWALVIMAPVTIPATILLWEPAYWSASAPAVASLLYVGVFSVFIGFFFWNAGLAIGGVARVGQLQLLQTFFTLAGAAAINGEPIGADLVIFAVVVAVIVFGARKAAVGRAR